MSYIQALCESVVVVFVRFVIHVRCQIIFEHAFCCFLIWTNKLGFYPDCSIKIEIKLYNNERENGLIAVNLRKLFPLPECHTVIWEYHVFSIKMPAPARPR